MKGLAAARACSSVAAGERRVLAGAQRVACAPEGARRWRTRSAVPIDTDEKPPSRLQAAMAMAKKAAPFARYNKEAQRQAYLQKLAVTNALDRLEHAIPVKAKRADMDRWSEAAFKVLRMREFSGVSGARLLQLVSKCAKVSEKHEQLLRSGLLAVEHPFWRTWKAEMIDRLRGQTGDGEDAVLLSSVLHAIGFLELPVSAEWIRNWLHSAGSMSNFTPTALSNTIWAVVKLGKRFPQNEVYNFASTWSTRVEYCANEFEENNAATSLWALTHHADPMRKAVKSLQRRFIETLRLPHPKPLPADFWERRVQHIATVLWASSGRTPVIDSHMPGGLNELFQAAVQVPPHLVAAQPAAMVMFALGKMEAQFPRKDNALLDSLLRWWGEVILNPACLHSLRNAECINALWGIAQMRIGQEKWGQLGHPGLIDVLFVKAAIGKAQWNAYDSLTMLYVTAALKYKLTPRLSRTLIAACETHCTSWNQKSLASAKKSAVKCRPQLALGPQFEKQLRLRTAS